MPALPSAVTATVRIAAALVSALVITGLEAARGRVRFSLVRQSQRGQRDSREAETEFLQRPAAGEGLGRALGQFNRCDGAAVRRVEFVVHNFTFRLAWLSRKFLPRRNVEIVAAETARPIGNENQT